MEVISLYEMSVSGLWLMMAGGFAWLLFQDEAWKAEDDNSLIERLKNRYSKGEISRREFEDVRKTILSKH